jgi:hypothetical protein
MAFNPNLLVKLQPSSLFTEPAAIPSVIPQKVNVQIWSYQAGSDTTIAVQTAGYFVYYADWVNTLIYNDGQFLRVGDLIYVVAADSTFWLVVTGIGSTITTAPYGIGYIQALITPAQFKTIYSAPLEILPPQGTNQVILVQYAALSIAFATTQYASGGAVALQADSTVHGAGTLLTSTIAAATINGWAASHAIVVAGALASSATTAIANKGLYLSAQTADFTTGDSPFKLDVYYSVVSL